MKRNGSTKTVDRMPQMQQALAALQAQELLVGFPASTAARDDGPINNPTLGYLHEHGAPEINLPARPFLRPGINKVKDKLGKRLGQAAKSALGGDLPAIERQLVRAGLETVASIVSVLDAGVPPPLANSTLEARAARVPSRTAEKAELARRAAGHLPSTDLVKPLIDTGALKQAITYAIRQRRPG